MKNKTIIIISIAVAAVAVATAVTKTVVGKKEEERASAEFEQAVQQIITDTNEAIEKAAVAKTLEEKKTVHTDFIEKSKKGAKGYQEYINSVETTDNRSVEAARSEFATAINNWQKEIDRYENNYRNIIDADVADETKSERLDELLESAESMENAESVCEKKNAAFDNAVIAYAKEQKNKQETATPTPTSKPISTPTPTRTPTPTPTPKPSTPTTPTSIPTTPSSTPTTKTSTPTQNPDSKLVIPNSTPTTQQSTFTQTPDSKLVIPTATPTSTPSTKSPNSVWGVASAE